MKFSQNDGALAVLLQGHSGCIANIVIIQLILRICSVSKENLFQETLCFHLKAKT